MDIIKRLAESDPTYENGMGDIYCVFCGPLDYGEDGPTVHSPDCLWLYAQQAQQKEIDIIRSDEERRMDIPEGSDDFDDFIKSLDLPKYKYEARIYSADGKHEKVFTDQAFVDKLNLCNHFTALIHETKATILEVEEVLSPLKPRAKSLILETKGGGVT